ncbi:MAG: hypothetical protein ACK4WH_01615 [Phycisphaerales bacterium]
MNPRAVEVRRAMGGVWRAASGIAGGVIAGFAVGYLLVIARLVTTNSHARAVEAGVPGLDQLSTAYRFHSTGAWLRLCRFPEYAVADPARWVVSAALVIGAVVLGVLCGVLAPLRFAPGTLSQSPRSSAGKIRSQWREALTDAARSLGDRATLLLFSAATFAFVIGFQAFHVMSYEWSLNRGVPTSPNTPSVGLFAIEDATWLAALAIGVWVLIVRRGRHRLRASESFNSTWCIKCGYPRDQMLARAAPCAECGAVWSSRPRDSKPRRSLKWSWLVPAGFALALHAAVPQLPALVRMVMGTTEQVGWVAIVPCNGAVIVAERPSGLLWMKYEVSIIDGATTNWLLVTVSQPSSTNAETLDSIRIELTANKPVERTITLRNGEVTKFNVDFQGSSVPIAVYFSPGGATSIRAVRTEEAPDIR